MNIHDMIKSHTSRLAIVAIIVALAVLLLMPVEMSAQQTAAIGQQLYVMKILNPQLKIVGVLGSSLSDEDLQYITRMGIAQGIEIIFARPKGSNEIAKLYKLMVSTQKVQMIWLPDSNDVTMLGIGFQFLRENTLLDKVGLCTPFKPMVDTGALCSVQKENGKVVAYVNKRNADLLNISVPVNEPNALITYVMR